MIHWWIFSAASALVILRDMSFVNDRGPDSQDIINTLCQPCHRIFHSSRGCSSHNASAGTSGQLGSRYTRCNCGCLTGINTLTHRNPSVLYNNRAVSKHSEARRSGSCLTNTWLFQIGIKRQSKTGSAVTKGALSRNFTIVDDTQISQRNWAHRTIWLETYQLSMNLDLPLQIISKNNL